MPGAWRECWILWDWTFNSCKLPCECWEPNPGPLQVLLTHELFLQLLNHHHHHHHHHHHYKPTTKRPQLCCGDYSKIAVGRFFLFFLTRCDFTCLLIPTLRKQSQADLWKFGSSLVYIASSKSVGTTQWALTQNKQTAPNKQTENQIRQQKQFILGLGIQLVGRMLALQVELQH